MIHSAHVRLLVTDFPAEFRFYRDVLGFKPTFGQEDENCRLHGPGFGIALFKRRLMSETVHTLSKPVQADEQDRVALIFGVASVDETAKFLEAHGVSLVTSPHDRKEWGIRVAHFRDPDGNLIEINHGLAP